MAYSHTNVTLRGFHFEDFSLTVNLASDVTAEHVGCALAVDPTGPNKLKLAGDGESVIARLATFEKRDVEGTRVGAAEFRFANILPIATGANVAVGDTVVGAGGGKVKAGPTKAPHINWVAEIQGSNAVVVQL